MGGINNFEKDAKKHKNPNPYQTTKNYNKSFENTTSNDKFMYKVKIWASFYRQYPFMFAKDYLGIDYLKLFQKILLYCMFHFHFFMFIAARGLGKSWLTALFCVCKALLYPKCRIIIASGNLKQATQIINYIDEMRKESECLNRSISYLSDNTNNARVEFWNSSSIIVVASNSGARSKRANVLVVDEFILVDKNTINTVLRKFKANPRQPKYLNKPEYAHLTERNQEIYLSSAGQKWHWSYEKFKAFFNSMMSGKKYFLCDLPYQLTIKEGLRVKEEVLDEMQEDDFDPIAWETEMEGIWLGENEKSYFKFEDLEPNRKLSIPVYPKPMYDILKDSSFKYPTKKQDEIRIISNDIAMMAGKDNDASIYSIIRIFPSSSKKYYTREVVYMESIVGGHSTTQAIRIRQLFNDFDCDYIVLDTNGNGISIYDNLCQNLYDKERKKEYEAFTCMNDEEMAKRCQIMNAPKKIFSIKGYQQFNSDCAINFRDNLRKGKIRLLINENEGRDVLLGLKGFNKLPLDIQTNFQVPYMQTTALINEMINLEATINQDTGIVKLKEPRTGRKDRWSSISYGNYFVDLLENDLKKETEETDLSQIPTMVSSLNIQL